MPPSSPDASASAPETIFPQPNVVISADSARAAQKVTGHAIRDGLDVSWPAALEFRINLLMVT